MSAAEGNGQPALSVTMPTLDRAWLFERALSSVTRTATPFATTMEVSISDGSADSSTGDVVERLLSSWPGRRQYVWNRPRLDMEQNFNQAIEQSTGEWVQQLHDDDYLLAGAGATMVDAVRTAKPHERVLLFGVDIVDAAGLVRKRQSFERDEYLPPAAALRSLLSRSSFVRFPAVVVHRSAYDQVGLFDTELGGPTDLDMWVRLFSRYGVRCVPASTCAYTVHDQALTTAMWNPATIDVLLEIFDRAVAQGVVPEHDIRRWQADYFHQWILAGAYRRLRARQAAEAREVLSLLHLRRVRALGPSLKWAAVRGAFVTAARLGERAGR